MNTIGLEQSNDGYLNLDRNPVHRRYHRLVSGREQLSGLLEPAGSIKVHVDAGAGSRNTLDDLRPRAPWRGRPLTRTCSSMILLVLVLSTLVRR